MTTKETLQAVIEQYFDSREFNGLSVRKWDKSGLPRRDVIGLVRAGKVQVVWRAII